MKLMHEETSSRLQAYWNSGLLSGNAGNCLADANIVASLNAWMIICNTSACTASFLYKLLTSQFSITDISIDNQTGVLSAPQPPAASPPSLPPSTEGI